MKKKKSLPKRLAARMKKSVLTKTQSPIKCAWCGKPATCFLATHPHCGGSHIQFHHGKQDHEILLMNFDLLRRAAWKVVRASESMHVTGEVISVAKACEQLRATLKKIVR